MDYLVLLVKVMVGMTANGSISDMRQLRRSFMPDKSKMSFWKATAKQGMMAIVRVRRTRCHFFHVRFRNPSMAN